MCLDIKSYDITGESPWQKEAKMAVATRPQLTSAMETEKQPMEGSSNDTGRGDISSTFFVTNLPLSLTSAQLSRIFGTFAPVHSGFVVTTGEKAAKDVNPNEVPVGGSKTNKGYGYVRFTKRKDAELCFDEWAKHGIPATVKGKYLDGAPANMRDVDWDSIIGKHVKIAWAKKKKRDGDAGPATQEKQPANEDHKRRRAIVPYDAEAKKKVLVLGGPVNQDDWPKALRKKIKKSVQIDKIEYPVELPTGDIAAVLHTPDPYWGRILQDYLHNHAIKGHLVVASVKSKWDQVQRMGKQHGGGRLIVRNLSFDTKKDDLVAAFAPYGPLHSVDVPVDDAGKCKGFGFVYFISHEHAQDAIDGMNGQRIYAGYAQDIVDAHSVHEKKSDLRKKKVSGEKGRIVSVEWVLGKKDYEKKAEEGGDQAPKEAEADGVSDDKASDGKSDQDESDEDSDLDPIEDRSESDEESEHEPVLKRSNDENVGTTLFVRNLSFEASEADLYDLFKAFGPVRYARIVLDGTTKRPRGTAFVCLWNYSDARKAVALCDELGMNSAKARETKSVLIPEMSVEETNKAKALSLHGRILGVTYAVSKDDAEKLAFDRIKKTDRRNLGLMTEGVVFPDTPQAALLDDTDMSVRQASYEQRKGLLRTNPSLFISRTRLSIRQIPLYVTENMLRKLAKHALHAFDQEVKEGVRPALTAAEKQEKFDDVGAKVTAVLQDTSNKNKRRGIPESRIVQCKIERQKDRLDPISGRGRSKGYGFIQLRSHADALKVQRWINANPKVLDFFKVGYLPELESMASTVKNKIASKGSTDVLADQSPRLAEKIEQLRRFPVQESSQTPAKRTLIVEFSIENAQTVKRRAEKVEKARKGLLAVQKRQRGESEEKNASDSQTLQPDKKRTRGKADPKGKPKKARRG